MKNDVRWLVGIAGALGLASSCVVSIPEGRSANSTGGAGGSGGVAGAAGTTNPDSGSDADASGGDAVAVCDSDVPSCSAPSLCTRPAGDCCTSGKCIDPSNRHLLEVSRTKGPIQIDGNVDEWTGLPRVAIANFVIGTPVTPANLAATFVAQWDESNLYVLVEVSDSVLNVDSSDLEPWNDDTVELFLDVDPSQNKLTYDDAVDQIFVREDAKVLEHPDHIRNWKVQAAVAKPAGGWLVEAAIEWPNVTVSANMLLGFDVAVDDDDNVTDTKRERQITWNDSTGSAFQYPSLFGLIRLAP